MIRRRAARSQDNHLLEPFPFDPGLRGRILEIVKEKAGKVIVIVDDERSFTDLLERLLGDYFSCPILTFADPLRMLEAYPRLDVGFLVTDYYMPHRNGMDLILKLAELSPEVPPCVLITGHALDEEEEGQRPPHLKAILSKPFRWQQLAGVIETHWPANAASPRRDEVPSLQG
jgi:FixJ family two-component response regulator